MSLTEFLLARIAEDEARLPAKATLNSVDQSRLRRECRAKRQVVAMHQHRDHSFGNSQAECPSMARPLPEAMVFRDRGGCDTLVALAAVYAVHEDYRDEWRP